MYGELWFIEKLLTFQAMMAIVEFLFSLLLFSSALKHYRVSTALKSQMTGYISPKKHFELFSTDSVRWNVMLKYVINAVYGNSCHWVDFSSFLHFLKKWKNFFGILERKSLRKKCEYAQITLDWKHRMTIEFRNMYIFEHRHYKYWNATTLNLTK